MNINVEQQWLKLNLGTPWNKVCDQLTEKLKEPAKCLDFEQN